MEQYTNLALIYDKMIDVDYDRWIEFIVNYFNNKNINIKGKKALELGCGTGNMTFRLKGQGLDLCAIDISRDMLTIAEEKARKKRAKVMFLDKDMINFKMSKKFDFIFSFCDGYNYITDENDIAKSFQTVYNHLDEEGCFMFDISTAYKLNEVIGNNTFTLNEDELCYIWDNYSHDNILEMYITFFVKEQNNYKRFNEMHMQRAYDTAFIVEKLKKAGFKDIETYEDYSFNPIKDESIRATFIARK
jgi:ubiquinone/menaquinone biosynthesis C-methylase UbiE